GDVQAQLGVAVQSGAGASSAGAVEFEGAASLTRINSNRTSADDNVPRVVGLGQGSGESCGQQGSGKQGLAHSVKLHPDMGALRLGAMVGRAVRWLLTQLNKTYDFGWREVRPNVRVAMDS